MLQYWIYLFLGPSHGGYLPWLGDEFTVEVVKLGWTRNALELRIPSLRRDKCLTHKAQRAVHMLYLLVVLWLLGVYHWLAILIVYPNCWHFFFEAKLALVIGDLPFATGISSQIQIGTPTMMFGRWFSSWRRWFVGLQAECRGASFYCCWSKFLMFTVV